MLEPSRIVHDQAIVFVKEIGSDWTKPLAAQFSFGWLRLFDQLIFGSWRLRVGRAAKGRLGLLMIMMV